MLEISASARVLAIINPISGAGMDPTVADRRVALVRSELDRRHLRAEVVLTERGGHARELAAAAAANAIPLVIVWGGDGTLNEAASALVGSDTAIGLIPAGSGNGLAASLGVPRAPAAALAAALESPARRIDVGTIAGRHFFNIAGIGVDARIGWLFNQRARGSRGKWPYIAIGLKEGVRYRAHHYAVDLDRSDPDAPDRTDRSAESAARDLVPVFRGRALLIAFANGREYGMGATLARQAALDDGFLDAYVISDRSVPARFWHSRHLVFGSVERAPGIIVRKVRRGRVTLEDGPVEYHVDGEPGVLEGCIEVGLLPRALKVKA